MKLALNEAFVEVGEAAQADRKGCEEKQKGNDS